MVLLLVLLCVIHVAAVRWQRGWDLRDGLIRWDLGGGARKAGLSARQLFVVAQHGLSTRVWGLLTWSSELPQCRSRSRHSLLNLGPGMPTSCCWLKRVTCANICVTWPRPLLPCLLISHWDFSWLFLLIYYSR